MLKKNKATLDIKTPQGIKEAEIFLKLSTAANIISTDVKCIWQDSCKQVQACLTQKLPPTAWAKIAWAKMATV